MVGEYRFGATGGVAQAQHLPGDYGGKGQEVVVDRLYFYEYSLCVSKDEPLPIVFYKTSGGDEPVRDWLLSLASDVRKEIGGDIRNVQDGWPLGKPFVGGRKGSPHHE